MTFPEQGKPMRTQWLVRKDYVRDKTNSFCGPDENNESLGLELCSRIHTACSSCLLSSFATSEGNRNRKFPHCKPAFSMLHADDLDQEQPTLRGVYGLPELPKGAYANARPK